jgi:hypothetical protein
MFAIMYIYVCRKALSFETVQNCEDKIVQAYTDHQYYPDFKYIAADEFQVTTTQSTTNWCCGSLTRRNGPDSKKLTPQEIS